MNVILKYIGRIFATFQVKIYFFVERNNLIWKKKEWKSIGPKICLEDDDWMFLNVVGLKTAQLSKHVRISRFLKRINES